MLGDVTPQTLRITPRAVVYPGRDNIVQLRVERAGGRGARSVKLDELTRVVLVLPQLDPAVAFDSDATPAGVITWAGDTITLDLSGYSMPTANHRCQLIAYDAEHPSGQVLVDDVDSALTLSFREVSAAGLLPLPVAEAIADAPVDGGLYGRQNGLWRRIEALISGVASFNGRGGIVQLLAADIAAALGFAPATSEQGARADSAVQPSALASVATSGQYADLQGKPAIPATPGDIGAATAAQGDRADTAIQPDALTTALATKVDKVQGKQLSTEDFTSAEKAKLAALEGSHYRGTFVTLSALQAALPTAAPGDYADVDAGAGSPVLRYIWDTDDGWTAQAGAAEPITAAQVKALYESNPDTNPYSDTEKQKLQGIAPGATANDTTDSLSEGAANLYFTPSRVRGVLLTGLSLVTSRAVAATDSVLVAIGLLQAQLTGVLEALAGKVDAVPGKQLSTEDYTTGEKSKLGGIDSGATANQTDAYLLDRANHTGTQASTTISDFAEAVQDVMGATLVQGANVTITYDDVANTITIAAAGGGGTVQPWSTVESLATSKTLALADAGKYLRCTAAVTITVPPQSSVAWEANTEIHFEQAAAGAVTFTAGAGVTINKPASLNAVTAEQYVAVTLKRVAADTWTLIGALEVPA